MSGYLEVGLWATLGGVISLILGAAILSNKKMSLRVGQYAVPFAAGALLGATFFDLLPEAVVINEPKDVFTWLVAAIVVFFLVERYLHKFHYHTKSKVTVQKRATGPLILISDAVHNALDGVVIGAAFLLSGPLGIVTTIAVSAHEIPRKTGDIGVLVRLGMKRSGVLAWNGLSAMATAAFALLTYGLGSSEELPVGLVLGFSAGLLIYVAMSDLIPTIHDEAKEKFALLPAGLFIIGIMVVAGVTEYAHQYIDDDQSHSHDNAKHDSY